jgi:hypothetical protein
MQIFFVWFCANNETILADYIAHTPFSFLFFVHFCNFGNLWEAEGLFIFDGLGLGLDRTRLSLVQSSRLRFALWKSCQR